MSDTFKDFDTTITINGHNISVNVKITVAEDDINPADDFDFGNEKENSEYLSRFKSGELFIGVICVRASALGIEGFDALGGCHLHSNNMFNSDPFTKDVTSTYEEYGMIENALKELKRNIIDQATALKPYAE